MEDFVVRSVSGHEIKLDKEDAIFFDRHSWSLNRKGYVKTNVPGGTYWTSAYLARMLVGAPKGLFVDHINGDIYDNRKANLRLCSNAQNARNCRKKKPTKTNLKGVYPQGSKGRFYAAIRVKYKLKYLGTFDTAHEAALKYNEAAKLHFGEFASLNQV